jgi:hypothetical protein
MRLLRSISGMFESQVEVRRLMVASALREGGRGGVTR